MSIVVKGMDITFEDCRDCPLFHEKEDWSFCGANGLFVLGSGKPDWCPLTEIVTCSECKHAIMTIDGDYCKYCKLEEDENGFLESQYYPADYYCGMGKKKENDA